MLPSEQDIKAEMERYLNSVELDRSELRLAYLAGYHAAISSVRAELEN